MIARPVRLVAGFATVGAWTMASRVLGFLRDILIAASLGAGPVAEAFFVAFTLPNMFRRLFAEGAFNTAFVPLFAKRLEGEGPEEARAFAEAAFAGLASLLVVFTLAAQIAMPAMVLLLASGFAGDARFALTVEFGRIVFPYIVFISLAALVSGVLNALGRFAAAAAAPVVLNLVLIAALLLAGLPGVDAGGTPLAGTILSWGVILAGIGQLALVWFAASRAGMRIALRRPRLTPGLRRLAVIALPAALAAGVMQINLVVGRQVASYFEGSVAWLWLADRIYQLPLGVVGVAVGVVLLPELARRLRADDAPGAQHAVSRAAEFALFLTLPATVALVAIPAPITALLFERGAFGPADTAATAAALVIYTLGLPAFVLQKVVQPVYFAREDTATPLRFAIVAMAVNAVVAVGLAGVIGYLAAPLGTTLAAWANLWLLWRGARRVGAELAPDARFARRLPRIGLAALGMGAVLLAGAAAGEAVLPGLPAALTVALVCLGLGAYGGLALALGAVTRADLRDAVRRKRRS
ncbi:murein biosynthesis integral membrane protein MurJ [Paralimibaculum aggregatum]|uniref:Probable lipid II flippase MurJ n=1 Tax=Paralimibaculum aggregatum TaxID=3036245 RepID=A0ABQ6LLX2_9RHOB|nr:murein biosynthesis integral membrane protein MurJ [Limibaculum sp. NKW23]GMG84196.1 murein biosynthesis integral membrane protein MurJ [Limibaculum sp. NKW23]